MADMSKTFKADPDSDAGLRVSPNSSRLHGNKENFVQCDERGTIFAGPMSFAVSTTQMRYNALFTMNSALQLAIPSTLATPTPVFKVDPPMKQLAGLMKDSITIMALQGIFLV